MLLVPQPLQASLQLGCVATVDPAHRHRPLSEGFALSQLRMRTSTECPYLEGEGPDGLGPLRQVCFPCLLYLMKQVSLWEQPGCSAAGCDICALFMGHVGGWLILCTLAAHASWLPWFPVLYEADLPAFRMFCADQIEPS